MNVSTLHIAKCPLSFFSSLTFSFSVLLLSIKKVRPSLQSWHSVFGTMTELHEGRILYPARKWKYQFEKHPLGVQEQPDVERLKNSTSTAFLKAIFHPIAQGEVNGASLTNWCQLGGIKCCWPQVSLSLISSEQPRGATATALAQR